MPLLKSDTVRLNVLLNGAHRQTIFPNVFRIVSLKAYQRERLDLPDGDFIDLDWLKNGSKKLVIALHGLEGSSQRQYIKGILKEMHAQGWDGLGFNFRGCGGSPNLTERFYHSGDTADLSFLIDKIQAEGYYKTVVLVGYSLGANVALLYAGQKGNKIPTIVKSVVGVSAPCSLSSSVDEIHKLHNRQYVIKFLIPLKKKVKLKRDLLQAYDIPHILKSKDFSDWDNRLTAPVHGFDSAKDYWDKVSSLKVLENIAIPSLILNAKNDTFLSTGCYPYDLARASKNLHLLTPDWGGHVGFVDRFPWRRLWSERKIAQFFREMLSL